MMTLQHFNPILKEIPEKGGVREQMAVDLKAAANRRLTETMGKKQGASVKAPPFQKTLPAKPDAKSSAVQRRMEMMKSKGKK